jgi:yecA family protein
VEEPTQVCQAGGMNGIEIPTSDAGLEALDAFLSSEDSPPESMQISGLDGFLTGIAIGPEVIMPS